MITDFVCSTLGLVTDFVCLKHRGLVTSYKMLQFLSVSNEASRVDYLTNTPQNTVCFAMYEYMAKIQCMDFFAVLKRTFNLLIYSKVRTVCALFDARTRTDG